MEQIPQAAGARQHAAVRRRGDAEVPAHERTDRVDARPPPTPGRRWPGAEVFQAAFEHAGSPGRGVPARPGSCRPSRRSSRCSPCASPTGRTARSRSPRSASRAAAAPGPGPSSWRPRSTPRRRRAGLAGRRLGHRRRPARSCARAPLRPGAGHRAVVRRRRSTGPRPIGVARRPVRHRAAPGRPPPAASGWPRSSWRSPLDRVERGRPVLHRFDAARPSAGARPAFAVAATFGVGTLTLPAGALRAAARRPTHLGTERLQRVRTVGRTGHRPARIRILISRLLRPRPPERSERWDCGSRSTSSVDVPTRPSSSTTTRRRTCRRAAGAGSVVSTTAPSSRPTSRRLATAASDRPDRRSPRRTPAAPVPARRFSRVRPRARPRPDTTTPSRSSSVAPTARPAAPGARRRLRRAAAHRAREVHRPVEVVRPHPSVAVADAVRVLALCSEPDVVERQPPAGSRSNNCYNYATNYRSRHVRPARQGRRRHVRRALTLRLGEASGAGRHAARCRPGRPRHVPDRRRPRRPRHRPGWDFHLVSPATRAAGRLAQVPASAPERPTATTPATSSPAPRSPIRAAVRRLLRLPVAWRARPLEVCVSARCPGPDLQRSPPDPRLAGRGRTGGRRTLRALVASLTAASPGPDRENPAAVLGYRGVACRRRRR